MCVKEARSGELETFPEMVMQRTCFTFELVEGQEEEYDRRHRAVWPELTAELRAAGVGNYTIFRRGREVIAYAECEPDAATAFGRVAETDANKRWNDWFSGVIVNLPGGGLATVPEVWHLD
jgi:L-rhamnose mutarotase